MANVMTMTWTNRLHSSHESEAEDDGQGTSQPRHSILGELVACEDLEECDVEEGAGSQALEDSDGEDVSARVVILVLVQGDDDADQDANRSVEAEDDHVHDQLHLLDPAGQHVGANAEHNGHRVQGDGPRQQPHPGLSLIQANGHALEQAVDRESHHRQNASQRAEDVALLVSLGPVLWRGWGTGLGVGVRGRAQASAGNAVDVRHRSVTLRVVAHVVHSSSHVLNCNKLLSQRFLTRKVCVSVSAEEFVHNRLNQENQEKSCPHHQLRKGILLQGLGERSLPGRLLQHLPDLLEHVEEHRGEQHASSET